MSMVCKFLCVQESVLFIVVKYAVQWEASSF